MVQQDGQVRIRAERVNGCLLADVEGCHRCQRAPKVKPMSFLVCHRLFPLDQFLPCFFLQDGLLLLRIHRQQRHRYEEQGTLVYGLPIRLAFC